VGGTTALGLVEGNSTNTVNTVEDTEFSSSNVDSKSRAGIEVSANSSNNKHMGFAFEIGIGIGIEIGSVHIQSKFHNA